MKRNIIFIILLCCFHFSYLQAQIHYNSVKTTVARTATTVTSNFTVNNSVTTYQYFDDLGRPYQTVQASTNPGQLDMVTHQEYDALGRESVSWLPVILTAGNNGKPVSLATVQSRSSLVYGDAKAYSKSVLDPLDRILEQYGPGQNWHNNGKSIKTEYLTNTASGELACRWYQTINGSIQISILPGKENYPPYELYVTRTTDEGGTGVSLEFKNKQGQLLLTRQKNGTDYHDTYYVYDFYGNVCAVLPPLASDAFAQVGSWASNTDGTDALSRYAYLYYYDNRNRCTSKKLPGIGWVRYGYDRSDRLIYTQDEEQAAKSPKLCTFYLYDDYNRPVIQGICEFTGSITSIISSLVTTSLLYSSNTSVSSAGVANSGYSANISLSAPNVHVVNYYDNYYFLNLTGFNDTNFAADTPAGNTGKGQLTGTVTTLLDDSGRKLYTVYYYDEKGRIKKTVASNHLGGYDKTTITYTFSGEASTVTHVHTATGKDTQTEVYTYSYDHAGRLLKTTHKLNTGEAVTLAQNTYDEVGRLKTNQKHTHANLKISYGYNVRSWTNSITNPYFNETLTYADNGNITAIEWIQEGKTRNYDYTYDNLSRLTAAAYTGEGNYNTAYTYDKHGNMQALVRYGYTTATTNGRLIDNLTLAYSGNQLIKAEDTETTSSFELNDFKNYSNVAIEYTYDKNGSMTKDMNKGISEIQYNSLNLPRKVDIKSPIAEARNEYTYSADGRKLKVVQKWAGTYSYSPVIGSAVNTAALSNTRTMDYVGNIIYENNKLDKILIDGGYIKGGVYYFYIADHLGNNRVVGNSSGTAVENTHYYPFGMSFKRNSDSDPYLYNGKEFDQMHGLDMYDYSARFYEPAVGRFSTVDPLAEKYYSISPYVYCANNPLKFVDPTGMVIDSASINEWNRSNMILSMQILAMEKDNTNGKYDARITSMKGTLNSMDLIYSSKQVYSLKAVSGNGYLKYDARSSKMIIEYSSFSNFVHEVTHGGQYERGEIGFYADGSGSFAVDLWDEVDAYRAQYAIDPSAIPTVSSMNQITPGWVANITDANGIVYGPGGWAKTAQYPINANSGAYALMMAYPSIKTEILMSLGINSTITKQLYNPTLRSRFEDLKFK